jgi:hypothetical protein
MMLGVAVSHELWRASSFAFGTDELERRAAAIDNEIVELEHDLAGLASQPEEG